MSKTVSMTGVNISQLPDEEFRRRFSSFLEECYPPEWRRPIVHRLRGEHARRWFNIQLERGWRAPGWPVEFGGLGATVPQQIIIEDLLEKYGCARVADHGVATLGPIIMKWGTDAQKKYFLPKILSGEHLWAQGYSEPNAGSDLAGLQARAELEDGTLRINGTKIWTSYASESTHMFGLFRTNFSVAPQRGITFAIVDLTAPGVKIRTIRNLVGDDELCQVFMDDVLTPLENVIGAIDQGWSVAKSLLTFERFLIATPTLARQAFSMLQQLTSKLGTDKDPVVRSSIARLACDIHDISALFEQTSDNIIAGKDASRELSMLKIFSSELFQKVTEEMITQAAEYGGLYGELELDGDLLPIWAVSMIARPATIYGGTTEIQRNILAKELFA
jgi:alkylation response protein AidB-like acyl-CoA dehydrogenase